MKKTLSLFFAILIAFSVTVFVNADDTGDTKQNWRYIVPPGKYDYCEPMSNELIKVGMAINPDSPAYDSYVNNYTYGLLDRKGNFVADMIYSDIGYPNNDGYMRATVFKEGVKNWNFYSEVLDVFLLDKTGKPVTLPKDVEKITTAQDFCYVETSDSIIIFFDGKRRTISRKLINAEGAEFYSSIGKYSWYDFRAVRDDCFVMAGTDRGWDQHIVTQAIVFNWDGTVQCKVEGLEWDNANFYATQDGILFPNGYNEIVKYIDFDGNEKKITWSGEIKWIYDTKTYEYAEGIYCYALDKNKTKYGIINPNNINAFKGITVDGDSNGESNIYADIDNRTIRLRSGGKWGIYSFDGDEIVPFEYDIIGEMSEGIIRLQETKGMNRFRVINSQGEDVLYTNAYELNWDFSEGFIGYKSTKDGSYGFIELNKSVEPAIKLEKGWHIIEGFKDGLAVIGNDGGEIKFIDRKGKYIEPEPSRTESEANTWFHYYRAAPNMIVVFTGKDEYMVGKGGIIEYLWNGMPIGDVLYSDITAYINGNAIPTSVINGKTLVVVEDLAKYGFDVKWDGDERTLKAELNKNKKINPIQVTKDTTHKPGTFKCNYLYTDIKTYLSGELIESYAINGVTLIDFESLKKYGKLIWDGKARELRLVIGSDIKNEAYDLYQRMNRAVSDVKSIDMDLSLAMEYEVFGVPRDDIRDIISGGYNEKRNVSGNIKKIKKSSDNFDMELNLERTSYSHTHGGPPGHNMYVAYKSYYTGGTYYENIRYDWSRIWTTGKETMTVDEFTREVLWEIEGIETLDFPESAIKECRVINSANDCKKIEFTLDGEYMTDKILEKMKSGSASIEGAVLDFNIFSCEALIDKNNMMKSYKLICDVTVNTHKEGYYKQEIFMTVNSYNDVKIDFPSDLSLYNEAVN